MPHAPGRPGTTDTPDHALVAAVRAGDDRAFELLYDRYRRRIAVYVQGMVRDHGRAEDVTQEIFMSALRRMRATEQPVVFKPWIYEIAKNACIDAYRRSRRAQEVSFDAAEELGGDDAGQLVSSSPAPDVAVDTRMSLDHLRGAFGGLSDVHHEILVMRELEGRSYSEIGTRLGMSRSAVESTLFRARRRLSDEYEELVSGKRCLQVQSIIAGASDGRVGVRDERSMARHVSHCQGCRRQAAIAGFDLVALAAHKALRAKIAALLPLPAFVKRRWLPDADDDAPLFSLGAPGGKVAQWSSAMSTYGEQAAHSWGKAAALVAAVAAVGVGAGAAAHPSAFGLGGDDASSAQGGDAKRAQATQRSARGAGQGSAATGDRGARQSDPGGAAAPGSTSAGANGASQGASGRFPGLDALAAGATGAEGGHVSNVAGAIGLGGGQGSGTGEVLDGVTQTVDGVTRTVDGVVKHATDTVNETVQGAAGVVNGTVQTATDTVNGAVDQVTGPGTGKVDEVAGAATGAVNGATGAATGAVTSSTSSATGAVGGLLGRR